VFIPEEVRKNKLSPKSELMIFLGYRGHHSNMIFMRSPNNVVFTAATALFDEHMFHKCDKTKVPPVTRIQGEQEQEGPSLEVEFGNSENSEPSTPPPLFLPSDNDDPHDDAGPQHQPYAPPPPGDAPGGAPGPGPRRSGRERTKPIKEGNVYPPGTSTDTDLRKKLPFVSILESTPNSSDDSSDTVNSDPAIAKLAAEGGASWYNYLLSKAVPYDELPDPLYV